MAQLKKRAPFKFDIVGSFLRPDYLKEAREGWRKGTVTDEELRKTEDRAITELIEKQKKQDFLLLQTENFAEAGGIWILCGDCMALKNWK